MLGADFMATYSFIVCQKLSLTLLSIPNDRTEMGRSLMTSRSGAMILGIKYLRDNTGGASKFVRNCMTSFINGPFK